VKGYLGEGREAKNFAKEYLERRSAHRNAAKKSGKRYEDDLLTPAAAVNPNAGDDGPLMAGGSKASAPVKGAQAAAMASVGAGGGANGGKKRGKGAKGKKAEHLLGFSVTAGSGRVNAGELDLPH